MRFQKQISLVLLLATGLVSCHSTPTARQPAQEAPGYCMAIRGNGELEPAHWGAMARTVEQVGLPKAMAGGSSASISMFLMEAIASHPGIQNQSLEIQKDRASLMLKSLIGAFGEFQKTKTWSDIQSLYGVYDKIKTNQLLVTAEDFMKKGNRAAAQRVLQKAIELGVFDPKSAQPMLTALASGDLAHAQFYTQELLESVKVFGQFNAAKDANLFFRPGLVSFEVAATGFGKLASFFAAAGSSEKQLQAWTEFFEMCAPGSRSLTWNEIVSKQPACGVRYGDLFKSHFAYGRRVPQIDERKVGEIIASYPTTAVLTGSAVGQFREAKAQYHQQMSALFGKDFHLLNPEDLRFGYWGSNEALEKIKQGLDAKDEKSRRFLSLGPAIWKDVMSLSPAEPGLSPLKEFKAQDRDYVSAGGWADLHPVLVLKAAGCDNVVYITRQGGDSLFAQGVAKRLMNLDRDWTLLQTTGSDADKSQKANNEGDSNDQTSMWSRLYNLGNPKSSVNRSLAQASAVLCTDWNSDSPKDLKALVENSYHSSYWMNPDQASSLLSDVNPVLKVKRPGCQPL